MIIMTIPLLGLHLNAQKQNKEDKILYFSIAAIKIHHPTFRKHLDYGH